MIEQIEKLAESGLLRSLQKGVRKEGTRVVVGGKSFLNLSSNDYLGLAGRPELLRSFLEEVVLGSPHLLDFALGSSGSRLMTGTLESYEELEARFASFLGHETGLLFNSGYHANLGILPALVGPGDVIFADRLNHASLIDGMRLSGAIFFRFRHNDPGHLETLLTKERHKFSKALIVTESLFSMDGDFADLSALTSLKQKHDALLVVDEAHAIGCTGVRGAGWADEVGLIGQVDVHVCPLGKAWASQGAVVGLSKMLKDVLVNRARSLIFSTSIPPLSVQWTLHMLDRIPGMEEERKKLGLLVKGFRTICSEAGLQTLGDAHIVPIVVGKAAAAVKASEALKEAGVLALPVRPPTVPEGASRLRLSLSSTIEWDDLKPISALLASVATRGSQ